MRRMPWVACSRARIMGSRSCHVLFERREKWKQVVYVHLRVLNKGKARVFGDFYLDGHFMAVWILPGL